MKSLLITVLAMGAVTCSLSLNTIITNRASASSLPTLRCAVVLTAGQTYTNGVAENIRVYVSSSSPGAPVIPAGTGLGDAIAVFLNEGFRIEHSDGLIVYMTK